MSKSDLKESIMELADRLDQAIDCNDEELIDQLEPIFLQKLKELWDMGIEHSEDMSEM